MVYVVLIEFVIKMVDVGEFKLLMFMWDMLICVYMVGVILVLGVVFVVLVSVNIGNLLFGVVFFLVNFILFYLMGFDLLIGVFMLVLLVVFDKCLGVIWCGVLCNWGLVFIGNFVGVLMVVVFMVVIFIFGFSEVFNVIG